jgi:hypothetical protein
MSGIVADDLSGIWKVPSRGIGMRPEVRMTRYVEGLERYRAGRWAVRRRRNYWGSASDTSGGCATATRRKGRRVASLRRGSEHVARQQQAFARPLPPDRVPDPVLLTVPSCPFYGVTPIHDFCQSSNMAI